MSVVLLACYILWIMILILLINIFLGNVNSFLLLVWWTKWHLLKVIYSRWLVFSVRSKHSLILLRFIHFILLVSYILFHHPWWNSSKSRLGSTIFIWNWLISRRKNLWTHLTFSLIRLCFRIKFIWITVFWLVIIPKRLVLLEFWLILAVRKMLRILNISG